MATLTVGTGKQYATISTALDAARDGDVVAVSSGIYLNDFATIRSKVSLTAVGGKVTLQATTALAPGKALLTATTDAVIDGFVFAGARAADGTAAGLLGTGGALTVRNSLFTGNQTGLLVQASAAGTVLIQASEFAGNGAGDGFSGNINVGAVASLTIQDSFIHDALGGDEVKSAARATTITGSRIMDSTAAVPAAIPVGTPVADVNLPKGGVVVIQNSVIEKAAAAGPVIRLGGDTAYAVTSLSVSGDTIVADRPNATLVQNSTTAVATLNANQLYGFANIATGLAVQSANTVLAARPTLSTAPLVVAPVFATVVAPVVATPMTPAVTPAVAATVPTVTEYGRAGAVVANGTILTVGAAGTYQTLGAALAVAKDGDTIRVAAGTYADAGVTISHKLIIEGAGGMARFVASGTPANGLAQITTTTDVTLRNIEVTGAAVMGGVAAGIRDQGGNLTLVNSYIHDNQAGLVADKGAGTIGIYDSELARNGTADARGANLDVAGITALTLRNDWVHAAVGGGEVRSRAASTVIDASRILQTAGSGAHAIDLPQAGRVSITGSVVEKAAGSLGGALVHVGGDTLLPGSAVTLSGDTLISDVTAAATRFVVAEPGSGSVALSGVGFQGGIIGSVQASGATSTGALARTGLSVATTTPWGAKGAAAAGALSIATPAAATAHGVLVLRISGDAYHGNAQFTLSVDGVQVGDTLTATAAHGSQQSQSFTVAGEFAPGPHVVGVSLVNDLSGTAPGEDRNLFVDGIGFNGVDMHQTAALTANGTALFATGAVARPTPIVVNLSEDAWKGDAQALISIDGKLQDGLVTVTASHAAGKTQAMSFLTDLVPGAHTVAVTYLNDISAGPGQDRNLYVDSMDIAGVRATMAAAALRTNGTSTYAFTVAPPPAANAGLFLTAGLPQAASLLVPLG